VATDCGVWRVSGEAIAIERLELIPWTRRLRSDEG
jgi:hypothetical protein